MLYVLLKYFIAALNILRTDRGNFTFTSDQEHALDA